MARKPRIEIAGGLYHVITRGNNKGRIFRSEEDYLKFLDQLSRQKEKRPFYLYAYCLMPNHVHLLIEMIEVRISRIMQALLTAFSQYCNQKYSTVGHVLQGRYKGILCETDSYFGELVRYIHLNPVRAKIVTKPEDYPYSGHRSYLGLEAFGLVDTEPMLRHFGGNRKLAVQRYVQFVNAALGEKSQPELYHTFEGRVLGSDEFCADVKHRVGEATDRPGIRARRYDLDEILSAAEQASGLERNQFCTARKRKELVMVKEAIVGIALDNGIRSGELAKALGMGPSSISKRRIATRTRTDASEQMRALVESIKFLLTSENFKFQA